MTSLSDAFNGGYKASKQNDCVLCVNFNDSVFNYYDFTGRMLITVFSGYEKGGVATTPFSQLDRETLIAMRDKLIELKGFPPELPPEAPATTASANKLHL